MICATCHIPVVDSAARGWIHTEPIPEGVPWDHDIVAATPAEMVASAADVDAEEGSLAKARVRKLRTQMGEMPGVAFTEVAHDAVVLLRLIESLEHELSIAYGEPI